MRIWSAHFRVWGAAFVPVPTMLAAALALAGCQSSPEKAGGPLILANSAPSDAIAKTIEPIDPVETASIQAAPEVVSGTSPSDTTRPETTSSTAAQEPARKPGQDPAPKAAAAATGTLSGIVLAALADNPVIGIAAARATQSRAGVGVAKSALYPQVALTSAAGWGSLGNYSSENPGAYFDASNATGAARGEMNVSAQQLLYNFGATTRDIERAVRAADADALRVVASAEDIAFSAAQTYLRILMLRELLGLADDNLRALNEIARLVSDNEKNGNATIADVKRVSARVVDAETTRADTDYDLQLATNKFERLTHVRPAALKQAPTLSSAIPPDEVAAIAEAANVNPALNAQKAVIRAAQAEIDAVRSSGLPRIGLDATAQNKMYANRTTKTEVDVRGMVQLSYRLFDGGLNSQQVEQASGRQTEAEMKLRDLRDDLVQELRQNYLSIGSSRRKAQSLADAVADSKKALELYREQFQGGRRTLLELLDVQNSYVTARRAQVTNAFDERQATYAILRSLGRFVRTALAPSRG
ncbi:TolC family protein [Alsobacter sp. SYSU M60028]|uniref:TolC family protein n=1 Tax=Alsobacter ponti TaxID=2962936 RepID=A0ABT1LGJ0_9HYPH|nr:TolC family protein [Alsobacter ponti]MCP8940196.1 TolC family protein [Alsobacter ponti]